jgi:hypothetical protein
LKAGLSLAQGAAAVMPPLLWARPVTELADAVGDGDADGDGDAGSRVRPVKSEPTIRSTVPGARLASRRSVTWASSLLRVFTRARSAADEYSITELV